MKIFAWIAAAGLVGGTVYLVTRSKGKVGGDTTEPDPGQDFPEPTEDPNPGEDDPGQGDEAPAPPDRDPFCPPGPGGQPRFWNPTTRSCEAPESGIRYEHGLAFRPTRVDLSNLGAWLAFARPIITIGITRGMNATEIRNELGLGLAQVPGTMKINGRTQGQLANAMQTYLDQWKAKKFLELDTIQTTVALAAVGAKSASVGKKGRVGGRPVIVRRAKNGSSVWHVWAEGNRRGDSHAIANGRAARQFTAWNQAVAAATPGCAALEKSEVVRDIPAATFLESFDRAVKIWSPSANDCESYALFVGVCLVPKVEGFGALDYYVAGLEGDEQPHDTEGRDLGIMRHPAAEIDGVDWRVWQKPITWKRQYRVTLSFVDGVLGIQSIENVDEPGMDPCPDRVRRWPGIGDDRYVIQTWARPDDYQGSWGEGDPRRETEPKNWHSQPELSMHVQGNDLYVDLSFSGLPYFTTPTETSVMAIAADRFRTNGYTLRVKVNARGKE